MLLVITIATLLVGTLLMMNIYSIFSPFISDFNNISNYNVAYYGALSSAERAELAIRYHAPGFESTGGWLGTTTQGLDSDKSVSNFGKLNNNGNGMMWSVKSRMSDGFIPARYLSDVPKDLQYETDSSRRSSDFNMLDYSSSQQIALYYDNSTAPYTAVDASSLPSVPVNGGGIYLKLNQNIYNAFSGGTNGGDLDETADQDGDGIGDDVIVLWTIFGNYNGKPFTINPKTLILTGANCGTFTNVGGVCFGGNISDTTSMMANMFNGGDNNIREAFLNMNQAEVSSNSTRVYALHFTTPDSQPLSYTTNIISDQSTTSSIGAKMGLLSLMNGSDSLVTNLTLKLSLVNKVKSKSGYIYPFVGYSIYLPGGENKQPDRFYHINGEGKVGDYDVHIQIDRPTFDTSVGSDFVILF